MGFSSLLHSVSKITVHAENSHSFRKHRFTISIHAVNVSVLFYRLLRLYFFILFGFRISLVKNSFIVKMHPSILLFMYTGLCSTIDTDTHQKLPTSTQKRNQRFMLLLCLGDMCNALKVDSANRDDVCTWSGVECTDGFVTQLRVYSNRLYVDSVRGDYPLEIDWIPATTQFVHLDSIELLYQWQADMLPRDLRYLYLRLCYDSSADQKKPNYHIDLRRLPSRMEELILIASIIGRVINLRELPATMRFVYINHHPSHIEAVYIDYDMLPKHIENVHVVDFSGKDNMRKRIRKSGQPTGVKVQTSLDETMPLRGSRYMDTFALRNSL